MQITWLGHSGFRIAVGDQILLVDPWLTGNPMFPADRRAEAVAGATAILLTHGHGDHLGDAVPIAREAGIPVAGKYDLTSFLAARDGITAIGFNNGGTLRLGSVAVTMVAASHSSSVAGENGPIYAGSECGYMIEHEGRTIYVSGDTDVMADMAVFQELHRPEIGILSCGGFYTMDMARAAYAARKFFAFRTIIPCHYRTFPALAQNADALRAGLPPGVQVIEPEVLVPVTP
jgi:L-ascorbate metabolism protein UlaG (beta-lactamase superfamily)